MQVGFENRLSPLVGLKDELSINVAQNETQSAKSEESSVKKDGLKNNAKGKTEEEERIRGREIEGEGLIDLYEKLQELLSEIAKLSAQMQKTKDEKIKEVLYKQIMVLNSQVVEVLRLIQELEAQKEAND